MRYAILFSGMSLRRHVNGLEFCYRSLVDHLGFAIENVQVLNYDQSLGALGDLPGDPRDAIWPGDGTPFRMGVSGEGNRPAFQSALARIRDRLTADDQLFINTTGHGGNHDDGRGPYLFTYPHWNTYKTTDFCTDLATLPPHRSLVVLMAQCFAGGFNQAVVNASRATQTFIASAAAANRPSHVAPTDKNWDSFERNWLAALAGRDVDGAPLPLDPDLNGDSLISMREAFGYATDPQIANRDDSAEYAASSDSAGRIDFGPRT